MWCNPDVHIFNGFQMNHVIERKRENCQRDINILRSVTFVTDISFRFLKVEVILIFHAVAVDICNVSLWDIPTFL